MGLKKNNVTIENLGVTMPEVYAQIDHLDADINGMCYAGFKIQTARDAMERDALDRVHISFTADKTQPLYKQAYEHAKTTVFQGWEDDIPDEENTQAEDVQA